MRRALPCGGHRKPLKQLVAKANTMQTCGWQLKLMVFCVDIGAVSSVTFVTHLHMFFICVQPPFIVLHATLVTADF